MGAQELITTNSTNAQTAISQAQTALSAAQTAIEAIRWEDLDDGGADPNPLDAEKGPPTYHDTAPRPNTSVKPYVPPPPVDSPPDINPIGEINLPPDPSFDKSVPPIVTPHKPSELSQFLKAAPGIDIDSIKLPDAPNFIEHPAVDTPLRTVRAMPGVQPASFDALAPAFDRPDPTDQTEANYRQYSQIFVHQVDGYVDAVLDKYNPGYRDSVAAIEARLQKYLDGGTGLAPAVEDAIYARARSKNDAEARRVRSTAYADAASRGFTLPTGAVLGTVFAARQAAADNNAKAASDIAIQQAELEQKNLQFALTQSIDFRKFMGQFALSYMQNLMALNAQAIDIAKSIQASLIEVYNACVRIYTAKLEGYKADAQVYEARLRSSLVDLEVYEKELQALMALTNVDKAQIEVFRAKVDAERAKAETYKTRVDAVLAKAGLEKLRLEGYQAEVQAYATRVQARNAEWQGFDAEMRGEIAKIDGFKAETQAFEARARAYSAVASAKAEKAKAEGMRSEAQGRAYSSRVAAYGEEVKAASYEQQGDIARAQGETEVFKAEVSGDIAKYQADIELWKGKATTRLKDDELKATTNLHKATGKMQTLKVIADAATALGQVYANMAAAAMSGNNSLAALVETV